PGSGGALGAQTRAEEAGRTHRIVLFAACGGAARGAELLPLVRAVGAVVDDAAGAADATAVVVLARGAQAPVGGGLTNARADVAAGAVAALAAHDLGIVAFAVAGAGAAVGDTLERPLPFTRQVGAAEAVGAVGAAGARDATEALVAC